MNKILGVVLAGGVGKRFWPIAQDKSLLMFLGKPLIQFTLNSLDAAGIKDVVIVANPENQRQMKDLKSGKQDIRVVVQEKPKGMGDALLSCQKLISGKKILAINAADLVEPSLIMNVVEKAQEKKASAVIPGLEMTEYFLGGYLRLQNKKVTKIVEKPKKGKQPSNLVNLVIHYFKDADRLIDALKLVKGTKDDQYEQAISKILMREGAELVRYKGIFGFVKLPWDVLTMSELMLKNMMKRSIHHSSKIHDSAVIEGPVTIGKNVQVLEHAVIKGPTYIGEGSVIGTNTLLIESMIGSSCVVGFASEVARSYLGDGCWLHTNYIGDSVLEGRNYFGAGAVTANFRFDEDNIHSTVKGERMNTKRIKLGAILGRGARVGVNASLMPGVKIGSGALVGPGSVQYQDVGEK